MVTGASVTALIMLLIYLLVGAIVLYLIKLVLDLFPLPATIRQIIIVILALIVFEVGGIRGTALSTLFLCCAVTTSGFGLLLSHQTTIAAHVIGAVITTSWWPMVLASLVLADLYAADRNSHRSFTARSYLWYERTLKRLGRGARFGD